MKNMHFIVWNKKNKVMCEVWDISWKTWDHPATINFVTVLAHVKDGTYDILDDEFVFLPYIGRKDEDNNFVYKHDIVDTDEGRFVIDWDERKCMFNCFYPNGDGTWDDAYEGNIDMHKGLIKRGNIYENINLINEDN